MKRTIFFGLAAITVFVIACGSDNRQADDTDTGIDTSTDMEIDTASDSEIDTATETESDTTSDSEVDTATETESDTASDSEIDTATETESDTAGDSEIDTATETDSDSGLLIDCTGLDDFTLCSVVTTPDRSYDICINEVCESPGCGDTDCNVPGPHFTWPDTNIRICYDNLTAITCPASDTDDYYGQDAQYGLDLTNDDSTRFVRDTSTLNQPLVTDNITGLVWQGCADGLTGDDCKDGDSVQINWDSALAYCETLDWGGYTDWYLPDEFELESIADYSRSNPAVNVTAFPALPIGLFWSSSSKSSNITYAWYLHFQYGYLNTGDKTSLLNVRCVRDTLPAVPARFTRSTSILNQPVVTDNLTGLDWQGCPAGLQGDTCTDDTVIQPDWKDALAYCETLDWGGHTDWYLPNKNELRSIVDNSSNAPAIDTGLFPATQSDWFWSSSTYDLDKKNSWQLNFNSGRVGNLVKTDTNYVRCTRLTP